MYKLVILYNCDIVHREITYGNKPEAYLGGFIWRFIMFWKFKQRRFIVADGPKSRYKNG